MISRHYWLFAIVQLVFFVLSLYYFHYNQLDGYFMNLIEVTDKKTRKEFHTFPHSIYKNDKNWAAPLQGMVEAIFDPKRNKTFRNGKAIRWVLVDENNKTIGRITAFINFNLAKTYDQPTGCCGFFECIDNQDAANTLFYAAVKWNKENGMEAMDGPMNFGENFVNHGLLVDGFMPQGYGMPYNPKYYEKLFREFGFEVYFEQYSFHLDYTVPFPDRFWKIAGWIAKKPQFNFKHFNFNETEKFIKDLHKKMFGDVWKWAGEFRTSEKNIGIKWIQIREQLKILLDDTKYWIKNKTFLPEEISIRFKHRIVAIHCFPNGNGRHSRMMADIIIESIFGKAIFSWHKSNMVRADATRKEYIIALREADNGNIFPLIEFAKS